MKAKARSRRASASRKAVGAAVLSALLTLSASAIAKKSDREQPMNYTAKSTEAFNAPNTISTLTGSVRITQGTLLITGNVAKIHVDADTQIARVVVTGNPAHIQQLDENNNLMTGDALTLDYDNINGIAILTTNAVVHQKGRGEFHGDKLTYNTDTSLITGESAGNGMVSGMFLPKVKPGAAAKPATPPATAPAPAHSSSAPAQDNH
ncbi:lipopolysaccharide transport periplasmic protein LptA [Rhodanobacter sp. L36]|uniref:lipopolysaccharide transport periplasmic protein LptA n=1 Tax=Rhodanobacter sp. L36 TaxID=1747221 RepID=UPI00131CC0C7|nr:lipopolysaccharide transport periplasmic protein LptA [Rhodanobacter sp. L36]